MTRNPVLLLGIFLFASLPLAAQTGEVTPFISWQEGGEIIIDNEPGDVEGAVAGGVFLSFDRGRGRVLDIVLSHQSSDATADGVFGPQTTDVSVDYAHVGGRYLFSPTERFSPYIGLTAGVTHFDAGGSLLRPSGAAAVGADLWLTSRIALRIDGRVWVTLVDSSGELSCGGDGGSGTCTAFTDSAAFSQMSLSAGVVIHY